MNWPDLNVWRIKIKQIVYPTEEGKPPVTGYEYGDGSQAAAVIRTLKEEMPQLGLELLNSTDPNISAKKREELSIDDLGAAFTGKRQSTRSESKWYKVVDPDGNAVHIKHIKRHASYRIDVVTGEPLGQSLNEVGHPPKAQQGLKLPTGQTITLRFDNGFDPIMKEKIEDIVARGQGVKLPEKIASEMQQQQETPQLVGGQQQQMG